jgi:cytochrome c-type biogenesis protein CcmH/NrfG
MRIRTLIVAILLSSSVAAGAQQTLWPDAVSTPKSAAAPVASLVDGLAARLHENPDDAGGWLLLAKSYRFLERPDDARLAYQRAAALGKTDPELSAWLALQGSDEADLTIVHGWISGMSADEEVRDE